MTLLEKFKKDHPNAPMSYKNSPMICPKDVGYTSDETCLYKNKGCLDCYTCWNRKFEGEDNSVETAETCKDVAEKITDTFVKLHETFDHGVSIALVYRLIDRGYFDK